MRNGEVAFICLASILIGAPAKAANTPTASSESGLAPVEGAYRNAEYGFRFAAPRGSATFRAAAPSPNHGAVVRLGPARRIEVWAAFDAAEYGSTDALLTARLPQDGAIHVRRRATSLGGRPAEVAAYTDGSARHVLVVRHEGGADDGVNYTVELTTTAAAGPRDCATLEGLLATFSFVPRR